MYLNPYPGCGNGAMGGDSPPGCGSGAMGGDSPHVV
jgi:hypothetical protein